MRVSSESPIVENTENSGAPPPKKKKPEREDHFLSRIKGDLERPSSFYSGSPLNWFVVPGKKGASRSKSPPF